MNYRFYSGKAAIKVGFPNDGTANGMAGRIEKLQKKKEKAKSKE